MTLARTAQLGTRSARIARRAAIKAAVAGTAAAVVWSAPRIDGLQIIPDYAAAASCTSPGVSNTNFSASDCGGGLIGACWGNNTGSWGSCPCSDKSYSVSPGFNFVVSGNVGGGIQDDSGFINVSVNGIDPPFQKCTVEVNGACSNFRINGNGGTYNQTFLANGNAGPMLMDCNSSFANNASWNLTVTCVCANTKQ